MAKNSSSKKIAVGFNLLTLIPSIVRLVEVFHGGGNGTEKKQAAKQLAGSLLSGAGAGVAANNPTYQAEIGKIIDATVAGLNASGEMPTPKPTP